MVENEIQYLSWGEFRQMAPTILQLEITRLETLMPVVQGNIDHYNALIRARFELKQCVARLEAADRASVEAACTPHLGRALLALSFAQDELDAAAAHTLRYIADRIQYIYHRIALIY
jgi:hypothetical protein